ncbi:hypothetical protein QLH32_05525 [Acinetobacter corruptisaponis]|uniref:Uncharacterized protein n=1 Tax=Acinetobacter corruptisaponis TaxID=3045147 RepID=A0ABY8S7Y7_9GAMM|nr:hypothetical protein [Acinetobacter sp. KCTC 92772]WHP06927.1 hypothetical protein QLH32_05525 [Acinetobacter sp. KCTC 92772]
MRDKIKKVFEKIFELWLYSIIGMPILALIYLSGDPENLFIKFLGYYMIGNFIFSIVFLVINWVYDQFKKANRQGNINE